MEENKVVISLEKYDEFKKIEYLNETIIDYILACAELENDKMEIDYNIGYSNFINSIIKGKYPEKYKKRLKELKEEEE